MRQRDWFSVGVRLIGVWVLTLAITDWRTVLDIQIGWFRPEGRTIDHIVYVVIAIERTLVGLFLFIFAHYLVDLIYRRKTGIASVEKTTPESPEQ